MSGGGAACGPSLACNGLFGLSAQLRRKALEGLRYRVIDETASARFGQCSHLRQSGTKLDKTVFNRHPKVIELCSFDVGRFAECKNRPVKRCEQRPVKNRLTTLRRRHFGKNVKTDVHPL